VLVLGAAGGVGHLAVQIAKRSGAWVAGTSSREKHGFLAGFGVDEPLDKDEEIGIGDVDAVLDTVGGGTGLGALPAMRDGGTLVTLSASAVRALVEAAAGRVRVAGMLVEPDRVGMQVLAAMELKPHVERTFPLEEAARPHELGEGGGRGGRSC
jgi:NADPH:quinone reductase-like Zn-dependent oxidoreductase